MKQLVTLGYTSILKKIKLKEASYLTIYAEAHILKVINHIRGIF
jgi:hypothetical protein